MSNVLGNYSLGTISIVMLNDHTIGILVIYYNRLETTLTKTVTTVRNNLLANQSIYSSNLHVNFSIN